jgi:hypothetical protein
MHEKSSQPRNFYPIQVDDLSHQGNGNMRCRRKRRERHIHMVSGNQSEDPLFNSNSFVRLRSTAHTSNLTVK